MRVHTAYMRIVASALYAHSAIARRPHACVGRTLATRRIRAAPTHVREGLVCF